MEQPQKSLRQSKLPDFFAAKQFKIMNLRFFITAWISRLLVCYTIVNTSLNSFYSCESLLLGRKCRSFSPITQYLHDVRLEKTIFG